MGDGAANALAIRDAKDWQQLHGNYSRWGFFHPGPAFFYLQGWAERLLYDATGIANSPMGAHHIAILLLNAWMLAVALSLLVEVGRGNPLLVPSAITLGIVHFVLVNRGILAGALLSTWPPHVLLTPFLLFTIACGRLAAGGLRALPWTVLSGSLLVHGHAAHGLFVLPMFVVAAICWLRRRRAPPWRLRTGRLRSGVTALVLVVFTFPLVIDVLQEAGGNLGVILQQLRAPDDGSRSWFKAVLFFASFYGYMADQPGVVQPLGDHTREAFIRVWPILAFWASVHLVLVVAVFRRNRDATVVAQRAMIGMIFLAGALGIVWAKVQMGLPENFNSFYVHGLALTAAWLAACLPTPPRATARPVVIAAWGLCLLAAWSGREWLSRTMDRDPGWRAVAERLVADHAPKSGVVALSFDHVDWPAAAGLLLGLKRGGVDARAGEEWAFVFNRRHALESGGDPDDVWFVVKSDAPGVESPWADGTGIRTRTPILESGSNVFGPAGDSLRPFVVSGLVLGEEEWLRGAAITTARVARMRFGIPAGAVAVRVRFRFTEQAAPGSATGQRVSVFWENRLVGETTVVDGAGLVVSAGFPAVASDREMDLRIETPDAWQPRAEGVSRDHRYFALGVQALEVEVLETEPGQAEGSRAR